MIKVSVGILIRKSVFLITSRPKGKEFEGFWEFPGGKIEKLESSYDALKREIQEELSLDLVTGSNKLFKNYKYKFENKNIELFFYLCKHWSGKLKPMENQSFAWIKSSQIRDYEFLPSNKKILNILEATEIKHLST